MISLATILDPQAAVQEIAMLARNTLEARFVFITLLDQQGNFSRTAFAGEAPRLLSRLNAHPSQEAIIQAAELTGSDGEGRDGLTGYLVHVARTDVKAFSGLLGRVLPLQVSGDPNAPLEVIVRAKQDAERFTRGIARVAARKRAGEGDSRTLN